MSLTLLEAQPNFPKADISSSAAGFLEFFLQNQQLVEASHPTAEQSRRLYVLVHGAIAASARILDLEHQAHGSLSNGMTNYEVISSLVAPQPPLEAEVIAALATNSLIEKLDSAKFVDFMIDSRDEFVEQQPNTAAVIKLAAQRFYPHAAEYAIMGAAIERRLELDANEMRDTYTV